MAASVEDLRSQILKDHTQDQDNDVEAFRNSILAQNGIEPLQEQTEKLDVQVTVPESEKDQNFAERSMNRLNERNTQFLQAFIDAATGKITPGEGVVRAGGKGVAGAFFDIFGEALKSTARGADEILPDELQEIVGDAATKAKRAFLDTDIGQAGLNAAVQGIESYKAWKEQNPRAATNLEAVVNIALLVAPVKVRAKSAKPPLITKAADAVGKSATNQKGKWVKDLILPEQTKKVRAAEVSRTSVSPILKTKTVNPTKREAEMIEAVTAVEGIQKPGLRNTIQNVINKVDNEVGVLRKKLDASVAKANVVLRETDVTNAVNNIITKAQQDGLFIVGEGQQVAERLKRIVTGVINKHSKNGKLSGNGLLQARRDIDHIITDQKPGTWNPNLADTAATSLARDTRNALNDILDFSVKQVDAGVNVPSQLKRQSLLLDSIANMTPKAASEANGIIGRAWQGIQDVSPFRGEVSNFLALAFGVGGLGASAMFAPYITAGAGVIATVAVGGKLIMSQSARKGIELLIRMTDDALNTVSKAGNKVMAQELRANRAMLVELSQNTQIVSDDEFKGLTIEITESANQAQEQ